MNAQRVVIGAWLAMIGLAAARSFGAGKGFPQPGTFLGSAVLFSMLYGAAAVAPIAPLAAVIAVGTDLAAVALPYFKGQRTGPLDQIASALNAMSGGTTGTAQPAPGGGQGNLQP